MSIAPEPNPLMLRRSAGLELCSSFATRRTRTTRRSRTSSSDQQDPNSERSVFRSPSLSSVDTINAARYLCDHVHDPRVLAHRRNMLGLALSAFCRDIAASPSQLVSANALIDADMRSGPMSSVPFDVLFLHLVLPASVDSLQPRHRLKNAWSVYWRTAASAFHLTSLMYGRRQPAKEDGGSFGTEGIWPILDKPFQLLFGQYKNTQTDARVPGADQIVLLSPAERRKGGVFVPVDPQGATRTPEDKLRLLKQDRAAREAGRDPKTDYTVIWLPRYWRTKIHAFIVVTLTTVSITLALGCFVPLVVGRAAMAMLFTESTHDGYNLVRLLFSQVL